MRDKRELNSYDISTFLGSEKVSLSAQVLEAGRTDTVYRDLYMERAHALLGALLPQVEYLRLKHSKIEIDDLLRQVAPALERQEWAKVKELTGRICTLRQNVEEKQALFDLAGEVYEPIDVPFNPFDPGLQAVLAFSKQDPAQLRDSVALTLATLEKEDQSGGTSMRAGGPTFRALRWLPLKSTNSTTQMKISTRRRSKNRLAGHWKKEISAR